MAATRDRSQAFRRRRPARGGGATPQAPAAPGPASIRVPAGDIPGGSPRAANDPAGTSFTEDGTQIRNRGFTIQSTGDPDAGAEIAVDFSEADNRRTTTVTSDRPFTYNQNARAAGNPEAPVGAAAAVAATRQDDGRFGVTFQGADTVTAVNTLNGNDTVTVSFGSGGLVPDNFYSNLRGGNDVYTEKGDKTTRSFIEGGEGDDTITTAGGSDTILGGLGNDTIHSSDGDDLIMGGLGSDTIHSGDGDDLVYTGQIAERRIVDGPEEPFTIATRTDTGRNTVSSGSGNDRVFGSLDAGTGDLTHDIRTDDGDDLVELGGGRDNVVRTGAGDDFVLGSAGDDTISGGAGKDVLFGVDGNDTLGGDGGDDFIAGGRGTDSLSGGTGTNRGNDFAGEPGTRDGFAPGGFDTLDAADLLEEFDFTYGRLTENSFRAVESTRAGQELLGDIRAGFTDNPLLAGSDLPRPRVVARDAVVKGVSGDGGVFARDLGNARPPETGVPADSDTRGPRTRQQVRNEPPVSGPGTTKDIFVGINQDVNLAEGDTPDRTDNTAIISAHELIHADQVANGDSSTGSTLSAVERKGGISGNGYTPNIEFDAVGLPYDVDGDGLAESDSADRFGGKGGVSENAFRAEVGVDARTRYGDARPLSAEDLAAANVTASQLVADLAAAEATPADATPAADPAAAAT